MPTQVAILLIIMTSIFRSVSGFQCLSGRFRNQHYLKTASASAQSKSIFGFNLSYGSFTSYFSSMKDSNLDTVEQFDFDTLPDRRSTGSISHNKYSNRDVIPLWVADMDFLPCPAITNALRMHAENNGLYGYTEATSSVLEAVTEHLKKFGFENLNNEQVVFMPGVVQGLNIVCRLVPRGSGVMVFTPIYHPFLSAAENFGRETIRVPLVRKILPNQDSLEQFWTFDWAEMERQANLRPDIGVVMLCNPHNPVGRIFSESELVKLGEFCEKYNILICSDEVHCNFLMDEHLKHMSMAVIQGGRFADRTITLNCPSKTFNTPGLGCSYAIITNRKLRRDFVRKSKGIVAQNPTLGYVGCEAAYAHGIPWMNSLVKYLRINRDLTFEHMNTHMPELVVYPIQATYMAWIDVRNLKYDNPVNEFEQGGVGLANGYYFGQNGFVRMSFALPRWRLKEALNRMDIVISKRRAELAESCD